MSSTDFQGDMAQLEDVVRKSGSTIEPGEHSHRMAVAMFWGVTLSVVLWAAFLVLVL